MNHAIRTIVCSVLLGLGALPAQAADQPAAAPQPTLLKTAPSLSLLPDAKAALQPAGISKIGIVDVNRVSTESAMGKEAQAHVKNLQAKLQKQVEAKRKQLDAFKADVERQLPGLTPAQRAAKSKEFQKKIAEFQKFGLHAEQELVASQQKLTKGLFEGISQAASELGKSRGLTAVVINRELLYLATGVEPVDISADVVKELDKKQVKK